MRNSFLTLVAIIVGASTGTAYAASNAEITITSSVVAATCDLSVSKSTLDLGNFSQKELQSAGLNTPIGKKRFELIVSNCDGAKKPTGNGIGVLVSGQNISGHNTVFNNNNGESGIVLSTVKDPTISIENGGFVQLAELTDSEEYQGGVFGFNAGLVTTSQSPVAEMVKAPILFSLAYN